MKVYIFVEFSFIAAMFQFHVVWLAKTNATKTGPNKDFCLWKTQPKGKKERGKSVYEN